MQLIYRIILKIHNLWKSLVGYCYLQLCIQKGLIIAADAILVEMPDFGSEPYLIEIGSRTKITAGCRFINHDGAMYVIRSMEKYADARNFGRIKIGENCFIGNNCTILPGASMGDNCILGAGSVLVSSMPPNSVFGGVPAKFICTIEEYGGKALLQNTIYPRELEKNKNELDKFIKNNLPEKYKPVK